MQKANLTTERVRDLTQGCKSNLLLTPRSRFNKKTELAQFFLCLKTLQSTDENFLFGPEGTNSDLAARNIFKDGLICPTLHWRYFWKSCNESFILWCNSIRKFLSRSNKFILNCLIDYDLKILKEFNFSVSHHLCSE